MSETIRQKAEATLAEVEKVTAVVLPEPKGELVTLDAADAATTDEINKRVAGAYFTPRLFDSPRVKAVVRFVQRWLP